MVEQASEVRLWRPQRFGERPVRDIGAPLIEPLWGGTRVLAEVSDEAIELRDEDGRVVERPEIATALLAAVEAGSVVLDGYLSPEAAKSGVGLYAGPTPPMPTAGEMARQMIAGGRNRRGELVEAIDARAERPVSPQEVVAFVAVDLLLLDGDVLLEVPLLERKRLLDSVIVEQALVRVGIHVQPPVDPWLGTWRTVGFRSIAYKDVNSRYRPGEANEGWATTGIPKG